jgi:hypothetical protein
MEDQGLSKEKVEGALEFERYGNKDAPYWFIGMEEGGGSVEELRKRASLFRPVEYLHSAPARIGLDTKYRHVPMWRVMSKLIMAIEGMPGWKGTSSAGGYQAHKLGRADGETLSCGTDAVAVTMNRRVAVRINLSFLRRLLRGCSTRSN